MTRSTNLLLALAGLVTLGVVAHADDSDCTKTHTFTVFEQNTGYTKAFGPDKGLKGKGFILNFPLTKNYRNDSEVYGYLSGLTFYTSTNEGHEVSTIHFKDIGEKGGTFADAEIYLRGIWYNDRDVQELSIVGGTLGLTGAFGSVTVTKVGQQLSFFQGTIYVFDPVCDEDADLTRKAHIRQVPIA